MKTRSLVWDHLTRCAWENQGRWLDLISDKFRLLMSTFIWLIAWMVDSLFGRITPGNFSLMPNLNMQSIVSDELDNLHPFVVFCPDVDRRDEKIQSSLTQGQVSQTERETLLCWTVQTTSFQICLPLFRIFSPLNCPLKQSPFLCAAMCDCVSEQWASSSSDPRGEKREEKIGWQYFGTFQVKIVYWRKGSHMIRV